MDLPAKPTWRDCAEAGMTQTQASVYLGRNYHLGGQAARRQGFRFRDGRGEANEKRRCIGPIVWTEEADDAIRNRWHDETDAAIGAALGVSAHSVASRRNHLGLMRENGFGAYPAPRSKRLYTKAELEWARQHDNGNPKPLQHPMSEAGLILLMDREYRG
jgi:hypothetical protein